VRSYVLVSPALATALGVGLFCMLLLIGCGGGLQESPTEKAEEEAGVEEATDEGGAATAVELQPANNSGTSGIATLAEVTGGVEVRFDLRGLSDPGTSYLAHVHSGSCGDEQTDPDHVVEPGEDHEHDGASTEEAQSDEISYPLAPVVSDAEGRGSSTTILEKVTIEELLSGEHKYINVHAAGAGDDLPPDIACGKF
jgi:hypothetical protein